MDSETEKARPEGGDSLPSAFRPRWPVLILTVMLAAAACRPTAPPAAPPVAPPTAPLPDPTPLDAPVPPPPAPPTPPLTITVTPDALGQGEFALVRVRHASGPLSGEWNGGPLQFFAHADEQVALIAAAAAAKPGPRRLVIRWPAGERVQEVSVVPRTFTEDRITVTDESVAATLDNPKAADEARLLIRLRSEEGLAAPLWSDRFRLPVPEGSRITTEFGEVRYVNDRWSGQHTGVDFGLPAGTPVHAPARGRVLLARELIITGHTVLLDHGGQLFTLYGHLQSIAVREHLTVESGELLGTVGSTGLSTGPHLHWSAYVGSTPITPWPLVEQEILSPATPTAAGG